MISGTISLLDSFNRVSSTKRYLNKENRNEIIQKWIKEYALKNKIYYVVINPDLKKDRDPIVSGYVSICSGSIYERSFYRSRKDRDEIIEGFSRNKKENYFLEITPNV